MTTYNENDSCTAFRNLGLTFLMILSLLFAAFVNWFITADETRSLDRRYNSDMMASAWTFLTMWSIIYGAQFVWMLYLTILTIRFAARESLFHGSFYIFFIICNLGNAGLMYFENHLDEEDNTHNLLFAFLSCVVIDLALYLILFQAIRTLLSPISSGELPDWVTSTIRKLLVIFCINAIAFYLGWMAYTCNLDFALALKYVWDVRDSVASVVGLTSTLLFMIIYTLCNYLWGLDLYFGKIYTVYPALIVAFAGVLTEQGVYTSNVASIYACVLFALNCLLFVIKVVVNCIKAKKRSESYGILDYGYDMASI